MNNKKILIVFGFVLVVLVGGYFVLDVGFGKSDSGHDSVPETGLEGGNNTDYSTKILVGSTPLLVFVARTEQEQTLGLSGQQRLSDAKGMVFDLTNFKNKMPGFWMKDMLFDLDLIWIKNKRVIAITKDVPAPKNASDKLPLYYPPSEVDYVLEVSSGWSDRHGVEVGDEFGY